ncbi:hypothetical protein L484_024631 [Morus notabilis]|uniref:Uncharacterized protein n=1 Tax=Morus notabilis TaxID=981085 RepID=W9RDT8_9ROSA|nr:hypothetical protein L484_024631 [Morus notabilis]
MQHHLPLPSRSESNTTLELVAMSQPRKEYNAWDFDARGEINMKQMRSMADSETKKKKKALEEDMLLISTQGEEEEVTIGLAMVSLNNFNRASAYFIIVC